jgi:hypothetical protein
MLYDTLTRIPEAHIYTVASNGIRKESHLPPRIAEISCVRRKSVAPSISVITTFAHKDSILF